MNKQWKLHMKYFMVEKQYPCSKCDKIFDFFLKMIAISKESYSLVFAPKVTLSYLEIHNDSRNSINSWSPAGETFSMATT